MGHDMPEGQVIWNGDRSNQSGGSCEMRQGPNYESRLLNALVSLVVGKLDSRYPEAETIQTLLKSCIRREFNKLLEQYLHSQLEKLGNRIKAELDITADIDYRHAIHSKFSSIVDELKGRFDLLEGRNLDMYKDRPTRIERVVFLQCLECSERWPIVFVRKAKKSKDPNGTIKVGSSTCPQCSKNCLSDYETFMWPGFSEDDELVPAESEKIEEE
jgi:hypothetical protein